MYLVFSIRNNFSSKCVHVKICFHPTQLWQNYEIALGLAGRIVLFVNLNGFSVLERGTQLTPLITEREIILPWGRSAHYGPVD